MRCHCSVTSRCRKTPVVWITFIYHQPLWWRPPSGGTLLISRMMLPLCIRFCVNVFSFFLGSSYLPVELVVMAMTFCP